MTPRDYQLQALAECRKAIAAGKNRLILCAPTGAGKTFTASLMMRGAMDKGKRCLCLVPKREHVDQFSARLEELKVPHGVIMAGRPYTPGASVQVGTKDTLAARALRRDRIPFPPADLLVADECVTGDAMVTTDIGIYRMDELCEKGGAKEVMTHRGFRRILGFKHGGIVKPVLELITSSGKTIRCTPDHLVMTSQGWFRADVIRLGTEVLCSTPSYEQIVEIKQLPPERVYDIEVEGEHCFFANGILVHNCHLSMAREWVKLLKKLEANNPKLVTIGLSATPARATGRGLGSWYQEIIYCSNYKELKDQGILVPARVFTFDPPSMRGVPVEKGEWKTSEAERRVNTSELVGDVLRHWQMYASNRVSIGFAQTIKHGLHLTERFQKAGHRWEHLDANTPMEKRTEILQALHAGDLQGVWQCDVLSVGHDFPIVSCIILAAPTRSFVRYRQRCGRGGRQHKETSKDSYFVLDHVGSYLYHQVWPDEDWEWTLDEQSQVQKKDKEKAEENIKSPIMVCQKCNCTFRVPPPKCPECGWMRAKNGMEIAIKKGLLKEIKKKRAPREFSLEGKVQMWHRCLAIAAARNGTPGQAVRIYQKETRQLPWEDPLPNLPGPGKWKVKVAELYPQYVRRNRSQSASSAGTDCR